MSKGFKSKADARPARKAESVDPGGGARQAATAPRAIAALAIKTRPLRQALRAP
ncbi:MAG: hypothetical protein ABSE69_19240 [Roseiarcus sp.]|jgi:hypothetical protein